MFIVTSILSVLLFSHVLWKFTKLDNKTFSIFTVATFFVFENFQTVKLFIKRLPKVGVGKLYGLPITRYEFLNITFKITVFTCSYITLFTCCYMLHLQVNFSVISIATI